MTKMQYLFSFQGRVGRGRWWFGYMLTILYTVAVALIFGLAVSLVQPQPEPGTQPQLTAAGIVLLAVYVIALAVGSYSSLAISVKRCHDRGRSGWFVLVSLIPLAGIWVLVELGILKGEPGPNKYGPDPQGIDVREVFA